MHVHHPAALPDLQHQRVRGDERAGAASGRLRKDSTCSSSSSAITDTWLLGSRLIQGLDQFLHPPGAHPEQMTGRTHRGQRPLRWGRPSGQHGKYHPDRNVGIASSIVPTQLSQSRAR